MEEYDLDHIPPEYLKKLFKTMSKYTEYNSILLDLLDIVNNEKD